MIDNTVTIIESNRTPLEIERVVVAYDESDILSFDYTTIPNIVLGGIERIGEFVTAWDSSPTLFQYNRVFFLNTKGDVEMAFKVQSKTQREIRIDMRLRECNIYTIEDNLTECNN